MNLRKRTISISVISLVACFAFSSVAFGRDFIIRNATTSAPYLTVQGATGFVGIGTTAPSSTLHVSAGTGIVTNVSGGRITGVGNAVTSTDALSMGYANGLYAPLIGSWTATSTGIFYNSGNVGIGTTGPIYPLQIRRAGGAGSVGVNIDNYLSAGTRDVKFSVYPDTLTDNGGFIFETRYGNAFVNAMAILATGSVGVGTTAPWTNPSAKFQVASGFTGSTSGFDAGQTTFAVVGNNIGTNDFTLDTTYATGYTRFGVVGVAHETTSDGRSAIGVLGIGDGGYSTVVGGRFVGRAYGATSATSHGIKVAAISIAGNNGYGAYIDAGSGPGTNWGLYQAGASDKNYFAGNVGIATTTPNAAKLVFGGSPTIAIDANSGKIQNLGSPVNPLDATTKSYVDSAIASVTSTLGTITNAFIQNGNSFGTTATLGTNDTNRLGFEVGGTTYMTVATSGYVGIGTTAPASKLNVSGGDLQVETGQGRFKGWYTAGSEGR